MLCKHCNQTVCSLFDIWNLLRVACEKSLKSSEPPDFQVAYLRAILENATPQLAHHVGGCQRTGGRKNEGE